MLKKVLTTLMATVILVLGTGLSLVGYDYANAAVRSDIEERESNLYNYFNGADFAVRAYSLFYSMETAQETSESVILVENEEIIAQIDDFVHYWLSNLDGEPNLHYYAKNTNTGSIVASKEIQQVISDDQLDNIYQWYMQIEYDENGDFEIFLSDQMQLYDINYYVNNAYLTNGMLEQFTGSYELLEEEQIAVTSIVKPITNMVYYFAIPHEIEESGYLYRYINDDMIDQINFLNYLVLYVGVFSFLIAFLFLFMPIKTLKDTGWYPKLMSIKFEFWLITMSVGITLLLSINVNLGYVTSIGRLTEIVIDLGAQNIAPLIVVMINVAAWLSYYFLIMLSVLLVRYILHVGIFTYIKNNTVLFWVLKLMKKLAKKLVALFNKLVEYDLSDSSQRKLMGLIIINMLILIIFDSWFFFILYSAALYFVASKQVKKVKTDYEVLSEAITRLSNTNFDMMINRDLGVFESLRSKLYDLKEGFETAVNEEIKSQKMKTELTTNISHDLKTPLTSIISYVELLKEETNKQKREEYVKVIERNAQRLKNLINDLFEISKVNSGNVDIDLIEVDVVALMKQVISECQQALDDASLTIRLNTSSEKIIHQLDSLKTYRMFENLIMNASKYALNNTRVFVTVDETESTVIVSFKNVSATEINVDSNELTDRFVRGDKSRNTEGSGLGLAIVKSFAELQNGTFKVEVDGDLFKAIIVFNK